MKQFLIDLVGAENVLADEVELLPYSEDYTEVPGCFPALVAKVRHAQEVQAIVKEAGRTGTPLIPRVAGTNIGGLTIPVAGGLILDMTQMDRISEINVEDMYAVIEPGVTQQGLKDALAARDLPLTLGYSLAPPDTSVLANCLLGGLTNRSLKYGDQGAWLNGLEVVLADGSLMRTGAWALGEVPFGLVPFPDISGLFIGWQGTTGIATRGVFQLWPAHPLNKRLFVMAYSPSATYKAMQRLCKKEICDDIGGLSWPSAKMMLGVKRPHPVPGEGEPQFMLYVDLTAEIPEEMAAKEKVFKGVLNELRREGEELDDPLNVDTLVQVNPALAMFADFPVELEFLTNHGGGGLTWIGTYGPLSRFIECAETGVELMTQRGFAPLIVSRPMRGGHFGVLRFIAIFDKKDDAEVQRVRELNQALLAMVTERGFLMYKTPVWAWQELAPKIDPNMLEMMRRVKGLMDPYGIFNPEKLGL